MGSESGGQMRLELMLFLGCGQDVSWFWSLERDTTQYPVNQWIILGEPVMSQNCVTTSIQRSYKERNRMLFFSRKTDQEVDGLSDFGVGGTIEEP